MVRYKIPYGNGFQYENVVTTECDESDRLVRVNLTLNIQRGGVVRLNDNPPPEIFQNGFERHTLDEWIARIGGIWKAREDREQKESTTLKILRVAFILLFFPIAMPIILVHNYFCAPPGTPVLSCLSLLPHAAWVKWDKELREWQNEFNQQVLSSCGIFVKTQSRRQYGDDETSFQERWISFALTPQAIQELTQEPHIFGYYAYEKPFCFIV